MCSWDRGHSEFDVVESQEGRHSLNLCGSCASWFVPERIVLDHRQAWLAPSMLRYLLETSLDPTGAAALLSSAKRPAGSRMLHLGCGLGLVVDMATEMLGWDAVGIDSSHLASEGEYLLGSHIEHSFISVETLPPGPFDVILLTGVLERAEHPLKLLHALREILAPDGGLLIEVGGKADAMHLAAAKGDAAFRKVWPTPHGLARAMRAAGFDQFQIAEGSGNIWVTTDAALIIAPNADTRLCPAYIKNLITRIETGGWLWNGMMTHLWQYYTGKGADVHRMALLEQISEAWRVKFNFDITNPATIPASPLSQRSASAREDRYPFGLATILTDIADRTKVEPGRALDVKFAYYYKAFAIAIETNLFLKRHAIVDATMHNVVNSSRIAMVSLFNRSQFIVGYLNGSISRRTLQVHGSACAECAKAGSSGPTGDRGG
jgi:SAM-dependent methyltransferase